MSLGRLRGRNHLCSRSGSGSGSQQGCAVSTQPAAPVAPLLLVEEREGDFGNLVGCCEVRHVMEDQSLPLATNGSKSGSGSGSHQQGCAAWLHNQLHHCFSRLSVFFRKCVKCCGVRQCPRGVMALQTLNLLLGKLRASSSDRCFITSCITQAAPQRSGSWSNSNP